MKNHMSNFKRGLRFLLLIQPHTNTCGCHQFSFAETPYSHFRGHPKVKNLDMMNATDYVNMDALTLDQKVLASKDRDQYIGTKMQ